MVIFAITLLIYILIPVSTDLYKNNFEEEFRNYFTLGLVFVAFLIYLIFALIYRRLRPLHYIILPAIFYSILWFIDNYKDYKIFAYVVFVIVIIVYPFILVKTWKVVNWWIISAIFIALLFLLLGFIGIDAQFGEKKMHLPLNTCINTTRTHWELKCTNREDKIIVEYNVTCKIEPDIQNNKGIVTFQFHNGSYNTMDYSSFLLPDNVGWIRFEINGKDNQKDMCLSVSKTIRIPTYEEHKSDKAKFITYLLALFGFIFTSIPIILKNIQQLMK